MIKPIPATNFTCNTHAVIDCDFDAYKAISAANAHGLMLIDRSPAHYRAAMDKPHDPTPSQVLGTLVHMAVLEYNKYVDTVHIMPEFNRRTKAGKEDAEGWIASLPNNAVVATNQQAEIAMAIRQSVLAQPFSAALFADGDAEKTLLWIDKETGVWCKARADFIPAGHAALIDLKTAADGSPASFKRACGSYKYHMQAAWYEHGAYQCEMGTRPMVFVVAETAPPYAVGIYQLDDKSVNAGRVRARRALEKYAKAQQANQWPGYPVEIQTLELSPWAV